MKTEIRNNENRKFNDFDEMLKRMNDVIIDHQRIDYEINLRLEELYDDSVEGHLTYEEFINKFQKIRTLIEKDVDFKDLRTKLTHMYGFYGDIDE